MAAVREFIFQGKLIVLLLMEYNNLIRIMKNP